LRMHALMLKSMVYLAHVILPGINDVNEQMLAVLGLCVVRQRM